METKRPLIFCVVPNWNGKQYLGECLDSLLAQSESAQVVVVDNGSSDGSIELMENKYSQVALIKHAKNLGFAGGVNSGIKYAIEQGAKCVALFNNDAVADKDWLKELQAVMKKSKKIGISTGKLVSADNSYYDSTGDLYTTWGYPYPRGRDEPVSKRYNNPGYVFAASGGASLYRTELFKDIGYFDEDFFAYNEDTDISFRAQLAGWKIYYTPKAVAYHRISQTGGRGSGFTHRQTMKNLPMLFWKNVPRQLMPVILPRFLIIYLALWVGAIKKHHGMQASRGVLQTLILLPKALGKRRHIQRARRVTPEYIASLLTWDLPPHTNKLHRLRNLWRRVSGKAVS